MIGDCLKINDAVFAVFREGRYCVRLYAVQGANVVDVNLTYDRLLELIYLLERARKDIERKIVERIEEFAKQTVLVEDFFRPYEKLTDERAIELVRHEIQVLLDELEISEVNEFEINVEER